MILKLSRDREQWQLKFWKIKPLVDFLFIPVGGGGLSAGVGSYFQNIFTQNNHHWRGAGRSTQYV